MCQVAYRIDTNEEIGSMGDLRRILAGKPVVVSSYNESEEQARSFVDSLPDESCLCHVELGASLDRAGLRAWRNEETFVPEYYCEALPTHERQPA